MYVYPGGGADQPASRIAQLAQLVTVAHVHLQGTVGRVEHPILLHSVALVEVELASHLGPGVAGRQNFDGEEHPATENPLAVAAHGVDVDRCRQLIDDRDIWSSRRRGLALYRVPEKVAIDEHVWAIAKKAAEAAHQEADDAPLLGVLGHWLAIALRVDDIARPVVGLGHGHGYRHHRTPLLVVGVGEADTGTIPKGCATAGWGRFWLGARSIRRMLGRGAV